MDRLTGWDLYGTAPTDEPTGTPTGSPEGAETAAEPTDEGETSSEVIVIALGVAAVVLFGFGVVALLRRLRSGSGT